MISMDPDVIEFLNMIQMTIFDFIEDPEEYQGQNIAKIVPAGIIKKEEGNR